MKKIKGHFWYSVPSHPSHPIKLGATRLVCKLRWTPKGECSGLVETSAAIITIDFQLDITFGKKRPVVLCIFETPLVRVWFSKVPYVRVFQKRTLRLHFAWQITFLRFSKNGKTFLKTIRKKDNFWTSYLKTHVNMVISKMVLPHPQLDIKF